MCDRDCSPAWVLGFIGSCTKPKNEHKFGNRFNCRSERKRRSENAGRQPAAAAGCVPARSVDRYGAARQRAAAHPNWIIIVCVQRIVEVDDVRRPQSYVARTLTEAAAGPGPPQLERAPTCIMCIDHIVLYACTVPVPVLSHTPSDGRVTGPTRKR